MKNKNKYVRKIIKKHEFVKRTSLLDNFEEQSEARKSIFFGFYNCVHMICIFYVITTPLLKYKDKN